MKNSRALVYIADDDADDRFFIRSALREVDPSITLVEAEDGDDLLDKLVAWSLNPMASPISLILLDMNMPRRSGLETLIDLRSTPAFRHIPIVMMSTSAEPAEVAVAYRQGISSYIRKPEVSSQIKSIIQAIKICFLNASVA
ncbi:response regulator [Fibrella sp. WM1]|uniref:response regulator n=1 Tax=Fibrella musci TaxID=3242485 RepID=UPI003521F44C